MSYLLGYSLMPRLRDLADQQLYRLDRDAKYRCLDALFRAKVDVELIREQWDQLVRVAALRHRTAPANVIVQRLANSAPSDRLAKALTALGRAVKAIYFLRYINDPELRHRVQLQLNRGESQHDLQRAVCSSPIAVSCAPGDVDEIMNQASCLRLLSNAVLVWKSKRIEESWPASGRRERRARFRSCSGFAPMFAHIIPNGTYRFDGALEHADPDERFASG